MTDKESKFDQIAKQIAEQKNYSLVHGCYNYRLCPDQYMGKVQNKKWERKNIFDENGDVILEEIPYGEGAMIVAEGGRHPLPHRYHLGDRVRCHQCGGREACL